MEEQNSLFGTLRASFLGGALLVVLSGAAMADDAGGSTKDAPAAPAPAPDHTLTVNGGLTTDYVFRGFSQSDEGPAVFAGADLAYRWFYAGVWASSVDELTSDGNIEIDLYGGIKKSWNGVDLDVGVIYYYYPNNNFDVELDYVEIKALAGAKVWREVAVTGAVYFSPDFYAETGATWTLEGIATMPLPFWGLSLSGTLGTIISNDNDSAFADLYGDDQYVYWNVGLSKTFREHYTVDVRYWGTDVDDSDDFDNSLADNRVVGTVKFNY
ncbi:MULTISPECIES: TorF family putative porin [Rhodomicrobium]|uniref:TorF family putative porin n=1 Tax=Rhodomicrobium TaxID=1068 RepID=UPI000B4AB2AC|nr:MULTISPECIES: TorF family putative porin [Rhodomicrobium]